MSVTPNEFNDRDEQAVWDLLARDKGIEPSVGFAERTLRRLHESPAPSPATSWHWLPVLRWAAVTCVMAGIALGVWWTRRAAEPVAQRAPASDTTAVEYASAQGEDYLEDFDVIASLDQLDAGGSKL